MYILNAEKIKEELDRALGKTLNNRGDSLLVQPIKNGFSLYFFGEAFFRFIQQKRNLKTEIKSGLLDEIKDSTVLIGKKSSDTLWATVAILEPLEFLRKNVLQIYEWCYESNGVERIGCCSRFNECSYEKKCIQPDRLLAKGCYYRQNLEKGKIFYGKNRNV